MHRLLHQVIHDFWLAVEVPRGTVGPLTVSSHVLLVILVSALIYLLCRKVLSPLITRLVVYTRMEWDEILFNRSILRSLSFLVFTIVLHATLPPAARYYSWLYVLCNRICQILLVVAFVRLINRLLVACYDLLGQNQRIKMQPLKGLVQMLQLVCIIIGVIISLSIIIDKNPVIILTSLGASAAVLMLVFKDTILGVVAGVQLSANDMLRKGDWIVVPGTQVNGVVQDVTLTAVKVQNFDNTNLTVPPYTLISSSFQNWRGMSDSGGRRVMRSVMVDVRSVRFCSDDEIARFRSYSWFDAVTDTVDTRPVNLTVFRYYLEDFIRRYALTNTKYTYMVRQLDPTSTGIPIQLYFFTSQTDWKRYEHVQADIFDHIYAMIGAFGLRIYQQPGADDILSLSTSPSKDQQQPFNPEWLDTATRPVRLEPEDPLPGSENSYPDPDAKATSPEQL